MLTIIGLFNFTIVQVMLYSRSSAGVSRHLSDRGQLEVMVAQDLPPQDLWHRIELAANQAEQGILDFFNGDVRSLKNGDPVGWNEESIGMLSRRLARKMALCHDVSRGAEQHEEDCTLRVAFIGSAQMTGRDMFHNETFPFQTEKRLRPIIAAAGMKLQVMNHAQDSELSAEGPQKAHMCVANLVGKSVDVIAWDLADSMKTDPSAQFEAFVRWAFASNPAMIVINRSGPHGYSRRGKPKTVVNVEVGHDAVIWEDDLENLPTQRENDYIGSDIWKDKWRKDQNAFWYEIFDMYSPVMDFAAVDPVGAIWHLDHLPAFSNAAFDSGKALPLLDCGNEHPAPCDQIPPFIANRLARKNVSIASFPKEAIEGGAVCSGLFGCRNIWYGGLRSHELRGELNALPIVRALRSAVGMLSSPVGLQERILEGRETEISSEQRSHLAKWLPPPAFCSNIFCNRNPTCVTSYLPNLGLDLKDAIKHNRDEELPMNPMPRLGAAHFADDPEWAVENLEKRFAPLGYIDRKYAYRLSVGSGTRRLRPGANPNVTEEELAYEPEDASSADIVFTTNEVGPLVLCEPPCFGDHCSKQRKMPILKHVALELDGEQIGSDDTRPPTEASGALCGVIADEVSKGEHILRITTMTKYPYHVLFSQIIYFG